MQAARVKELGREVQAALASCWEGNRLEDLCKALIGRYFLLTVHMIDTSNIRHCVLVLPICLPCYMQVFS